MIINHFIIQMRYIFSNKTNLLSAFSFMIFGLIVVFIFIPFQLGSSIKFTIQVSIPLLIMLGGVSYNWKKSTLKQNESLTTGSKSSYYIALYLALFVFGNILSFIMIGLDWISSYFHLFLHNWNFIPSNENVPFFWNKISWTGLIYILQVNIILCFAIYFLLHRFFNLAINYYIFILILLILTIIFGGAFNNYFYGFIDVSGHRYEQWSESNFTSLYNKKGISLFPESMMIPSLFFPFFSTGTMFQNFYALPLVDKNMIGNAIPFWITFSGDNLYYSILFIQPYLIVFMCALLGIMISHYKK